MLKHALEIVQSLGEDSLQTNVCALKLKGNNF
jgi:hypothetical protein